MNHESRKNIYPSRKLCKACKWKNKQKYISFLFFGIIIVGESSVLSTELIVLKFLADSLFSYVIFPKIFKTLFDSIIKAESCCLYSLNDDKSRFLSSINL